MKESIYKITENNLHIQDSCFVSKKNMATILNYIRHNNPDSKVWERSMASLRHEWIAHNLLYSLGLWKERTKDVDLDNPCDKPEWIYHIIGTIGWLFIK